MTCIPALAIVAAWFALRRWREDACLNRALNEQAGELADALAERRAMEEQLREGYKVAAMGTLGGGFAAELRSAFEPIGTLADEGIDRSTPARTRAADASGSWSSPVASSASSTEWPHSGTEACGRPKRSLPPKGCGTASHSPGTTWTCRIIGHA